MHGFEVGNEMGVNTWARFAGDDEDAVVDDYFAMHEDDLQPVLKAMAKPGHQHHRHTPAHDARDASDRLPALLRQGQGGRLRQRGKEGTGRAARSGEGARLIGIGAVARQARSAHAPGAPVTRCGRRAPGPDSALPPTRRRTRHRAAARLDDRLLDRQVGELEREIELWHRGSEVSRRLETIPGIGPLTASALVASAGDPSNFKNARQSAAWIGLVPHQSSSGGKTRLLGISKRGNVYLRTLLIHGGRALAQLASTRAERAGTWLGKLVARRHHNIAAVAMANKNARLAWHFSRLATPMSLVMSRHPRHSRRRRIPS
jgi:hypothetical protein